jgi:hypothetical protein
MNYANVKRVAEWADDDQGYGVDRLYCDGRLMCLPGDIPKREWKYNEKAGPKWDALSIPRDYIVASKGNLHGEFPQYVRFFGFFDLTVRINERYVRCFDDEAEFRVTKWDEPVLVYEGGELAGIVMPMCDTLGPKFLDKPEVPFLEDAVLYHRCDAEEFGMCI